MEATLEYLHDIVDGLDERDRQNLAGILAHKIETRTEAKRGAPRGSPPTPHAYVWSALCDVLGPDRRPPGVERAEWATGDRGMGITRGRYGAAKFDAAVEQAHEYVTRCSRDPLSMPQRMALARVALGCLFRHLKNMQVRRRNGDGTETLDKVPVTTDRMLQNVHRLADAVDNDYPGYASAGLLGIVLTARAA